jgi:choline monooxygenase
MSDPRVPAQALARSHSQLPVRSYFDPVLYEREVATLFARGPRYVGHELAVPEVGDFHVLPQEGDGRALVRTAEGAAAAAAAATSSAPCIAGPTISRAS